MAYFSTATAPERRNLTEKNRVWDFFRLSNETHPANRRQPAQPRRKNRPTPTKTASGIPYWPSRDPIGEDGGVNLHGFLGNDTLNKQDFLGYDDWHHELVQKWKVAFGGAGLDIDSPEFGYALEAIDHKLIHHNGYLKEWNDFWKGRNPDTVPLKEIVDKLEGLRTDPRFAEALGRGRKPLVRYGTNWASKEATLLKGVQSAVVKPQIVSVSGKVIATLKVSGKTVGKVGGKGVKLLIPIAAAITWCDAKAAGMESGDALAFAVIDSIFPIPIEPEAVIQSPGVVAPYPAPWDVIKELINMF